MSTRCPNCRPDRRCWAHDPEVAYLERYGADARPERVPGWRWTASLPRWMRPPWRR